MSLTELSVENGLCRCCLAEGDFKNLGHTFIINEEEEVYSRMLRECFGITINPVAGEYSQSTYSICEKCLKTLREANIFKKMVIESEIKFQHLLSTSFIKDLKPIKVELDEVIISADENKDDNNGGVRDTHIDDDDFRYPCSDEDDKSTLELKLELEPTSKKPKTEVKKDTQPYKTKLRKKKTTKESASVPQKKTRKGNPRFKMKKEYFKAIDEGFACARCDAKFKLKSSLWMHLRVKHFSIHPHPCKLCDARFLTDCALDNHVRLKHDQKDLFKCRSCDKPYANRRRLKEHMNNYHKLGRIYKCDVCAYETFGAKNLKDHKLKHSVDRHQCRYCCKRFKRKKYLGYHERIHRDERRAVCNYCPSAFVLTSSLSYHIKKCHPSYI